jgi:hypothetical protein
MDPARATWYAEQGLRTISPTRHAISMFTDALGVGAERVYVVIAGGGKVGWNLSASSSPRGTRSRSSSRGARAT